MSFDWTSQPLSIQSIASQYSLPVAIRTAPGFRGSNRPIILYSITRVTFAFGRALRTNQPTPIGKATPYRPIDSEIVAISLKYPGYFECIPSDGNKHQTTVVPETSIGPIVERMEIEQRPQAFYVASPIRVYTVEANVDGILNRVWHQVDANQMILFDKLVHVEYMPTENDDLTDEDYEFSWWFCLSKRILPRNEYALKCILAQQQTCYIPCSLTDQVHLIPVGQRGSSNENKLQMINNLVERFSMPVKIKLADLPGSYAYKDFSGSLQLLGSRSEEFAICASLSSPHIVAIPTNTPLKFLVSTLTSSSSQTRQILSRCQIFSKSFDMQLRRILMSSHHESTRRTRSRNPKIHAEIDDQLKRYKRSYSVDPNQSKKDGHTTTTDDGYRSNSSIARRRNYQRQGRSISIEESQSRELKRKSSTDEDSVYNSLVRPINNKKRSSSPPPVLPAKPVNFPYPSSTSSAYENSSSLIENIDSTNADGAILMDASNELFLALPSDSRFT